MEFLSSENTKNIHCYFSTTLLKHLDKEAFGQDGYFEACALEQKHITVPDL